MRRTLAAVLLAPLALLSAGSSRQGGTIFAIAFPAERSAAPLDGRLLLIIAADSSAQPRNQVSDAASTAQVFGIDVENWKPGASAEIDASVFGYPLHSLSELKPGRYYVQALLNRYEAFRRGDGHVVKLPPDRGEGQQWPSKPGNLFSTPRWIRIDDGSSEPIRLTLDQEIPPIAPPADTKYISTYACAVSGSASSGAATCTWARMCFCRQASTSIRMRAIRWSSITGTSLPTSVASGRSRPIRI